MLFPNAGSAEADDPPPPLGTPHKLLVGVVPGVGALDGLLGIEAEVMESHNSLPKACKGGPWRELATPEAVSDNGRRLKPWSGTARRSYAARSREP
jgi:hypothetical protein